MLLLEIALIILVVGVLITLSVNFFWIAILILIYRTLTSFFPFDKFSSVFNIENHLVYLIIFLRLTVAIHYSIIAITSEWVIIRYIFYLLMLFWVLYKFNLAELILFRDWFEGNGGEFSLDWFKEQINSLLKTSPQEYLEIILNFINNIAGGIEKALNKITGS